MSLLSILGVTTAYAAPVAGQPHQGSFLSMLWLPLLLIVIFYFLLIRPQSKRAKEHRRLMDSVGIGDEIVTAGGILARVIRLKDSFVVLEVSKGVEITLQKSSIASVLPKGTIQ